MRGVRGKKSSKGRVELFVETEKTALSKIDITQGKSFQDLLPQKNQGKMTILDEYGKCIPLHHFIRPISSIMALAGSSRLSPKADCYEISSSAAEEVVAALLLAGKLLAGFTDLTFTSTTA